MIHRTFIISISAKPEMFVCACACAGACSPACAMQLINHAVEWRTVTGYIMKLRNHKKHRNTTAPKQRRRFLSTYGLGGPGKRLFNSKFEVICFKTFLLPFTMISDLECWADVNSLFCLIKQAKVKQVHPLTGIVNRSSSQKNKQEQHVNYRDVTSEPTSFKWSIPNYIL